MDNHNTPVPTHYGGSYGGAAGPDLNTLSALLDSHGDGAMSNHDYQAQPDVHYQTSMGHPSGGQQEHAHNANSTPQQGAAGSQQAKEVVVKTPTGNAKTLPCVLANYIRSQPNKSAPEDELCREVRKVYTELRKPDGTKYVGDLERAVRGSLASTRLFEKDGDGWALREEEFRVYEQRLTERAARQEEEKMAKRKSREGTEDEPRAKRKYSKKPGTPGTRVKKGAKREAIIEMLTQFSEHLRDQPNWQTCFQNPFKSFKGSESEDDVWKKLGNERFVFMLQMFNYLDDIVRNRHAAAEAAAREAKALKAESKQAASAAAKANNEPSLTFLKGLPAAISGLQESVEKMNTRLGNVEGLFNTPQANQ